MGKIFKVCFFKRLYWHFYFIYLRHTNLLEYSKKSYQYILGYKLNLDPPSTLDEKIVYMSYFTDTSRWSACADKVKVRDYVRECGLGNLLNDVYGVYESPDQIDYDSLPDSFVIKTNNASGTNIIVRNKSQLDINVTNKTLTKWLKQNFSLISGDPHYTKIKPMILIEKLLKDDSIYNSEKSLADYKFFCINGSPIALEMMTGRTRSTHKRRFYDMEWNVRDEWMLTGYQVADLAQKPVQFEAMIEAAIKLSAPFPFVRVDFYVINDKPIFGELTFTPGSRECSRLFQEEQGAKLILPDEFYKKE